MADCIEREKVYFIIDRLHGWCGNQIMAADLVREIRNIPAADVRPERHGKWEHIQSKKHGNFYVCSECYGVHPFEFKFCHWCGAKMDEEED